MAKLRKFVAEVDVHVILPRTYEVMAESPEDAVTRLQRGEGACTHEEGEPQRCDDFDVRTVEDVEDGGKVWEL